MFQSQGSVPSVKPSSTSQAHPLFTEANSVLRGHI